MLNSTLDLSQKAGTYLCLLLKAQSWFHLPPNQGWAMKMKSDPYRLGKIKGEPVYKWQKEKEHQGEAPILSSKTKLNSKQFCLWVSMNTLWPRTARKAYLASPLESISLYKRSVSKKFQGSLLLSSCWCPSKTQYIFVSLSHPGDCLARPWAWMPFSPISLWEELSSFILFLVEQNIYSGLQWLLSQFGSVLYKVTISLLRFPFQEEEKSHVVL